MTRIRTAILIATICGQLATGPCLQAYDAVRFEDVDAGMGYNVPEVPVSNPGSLKGVRVAVLAAHGFEEIELAYPIDFLQKRGAVIDVITPDWIKGRVMAVRFLKPSVWIPVTKQISEAKATDYQAVLIPGGAWNPIIMRTDGKILDFVKQSFAAGKLVASVCHGPQVLISAGLVKGREVTGVGDIRADLRNAGGIVVEDRAVVVTQNLLTSRDPNDLAEFSKGIESFLRSKARARRFGALYGDSGVSDHTNPAAYPEEAIRGVGGRQRFEDGNPKAYPGAKIGFGER